MTDFFTRLGLACADPNHLEVLIATLYIVFGFKELRLILPLLAFSRLFNIVLKFVVASPLPESVCPAYGFAGYAFPSGHIHISGIFYVWLIWSCTGFMRILFCGIFIAVSACEIIAGFHRIFDVCAAQFFAFSQYLGILKLRLSNTYKLLLLCGASVILVSIIFALDMRWYTDGNPYIYMTLYKIFGFCGGYICLNKIGFKSAILLPMSIIGATSLFAQLSPLPFINQIKWIFIFAMLPVSKHALRYVLSMFEFVKGSSVNGVTFSMVFTRADSFQRIDV
ncbi:MAG: hypothetical protein LBI20_01570 [Holosporales bacterium]|jgi:undecaprenyl-diphosphatase|nr:hypothetical protein [Holosporales bacterium]